MSLRRTLERAEAKGRAMAHETRTPSFRWRLDDQYDVWRSAIERWAYDDECVKMRREHDLLHRSDPVQSALATQPVIVEDT